VVLPGAPSPEVPSIAAAELPEQEARRIDFAWALAMVAGLLGLFGLLSIFSGVAVPVLLALAMAYVLNPVVSALERRGLERTWGTVSVFAAMAAVLVGFVLYLVPVLRSEAARLPLFFREASAQLGPRVEAAFGISLPELLRERAAELGQQASEVAQSAGPAAAKLLASFAGNTARLVVTLVGLLVVPVIGFFFLRDYPALVQLARSLLPRRSVELVSQRFAQVDGVLSAFVQGQISVGAILAVMYAAGLSAARVEMAVVIGIIAGFGNMVPYLGTGIGIVLASLGMLLSWQGPWQIAVVGGTFLVAQLLESFLITPRVVGDRVGLSSVAVILSVLGFGELFGFAGILLAVPTAAILKVVLQVVVQRYWRMPLYTGAGEPGAEPGAGPGAEATGLSPPGAGAS
jgi:predicted PurR-regulated permease PerM